MAMSRELNIEGYRPVAGDYLKIDENTKAGIVGIKGKKRSQEDVVAVKFLNKFVQLSIEDQKNALTSACAKMQEDYGKASKSGTTAAIATAWLEGNQLHVNSTHLGDSEAHLVIVDTNGVVKTESLTKVLHKPTVPEEAARLVKINANAPDDPRRVIMGGRVIDTDTGIGLTVSRSFGDSRILYDPTDQEPDISTYQFTLKEGQKAFIVVACDGLMEHSKERNSIDIANLVYQHQQNPEAAAQALANAAYNDAQSRDNISAVVMPITSSVPVSAAVFDGHGGPELANEFGKNFYRVLENTIENILTPEATLMPKLPPKQLSSSLIIETMRSTAPSPQPATKAHSKLSVKLDENVQALDNALAPLTKKIQIDFMDTSHDYMGYKEVGGQQFPEYTQIRKSLSFEDKTKYLEETWNRAKKYSGPALTSLLEYELAKNKIQCYQSICDAEKKYQQGELPSEQLQKFIMNKIVEMQSTHAEISENFKAMAHNQNAIYGHHLQSVEKIKQNPTKYSDRLDSLIKDALSKELSERETYTEHTDALKKIEPQLHEVEILLQRIIDTKPDLKSSLSPIIPTKPVVDELTDEIRKFMDIADSSRSVEIQEQLLNKINSSAIDPVSQYQLLSDLMFAITRKSDLDENDRLFIEKVEVKTYQLLSSIISNLELPKETNMVINHNESTQMTHLRINNIDPENMRALTKALEAVGIDSYPGLHGSKKVLIVTINPNISYLENSVLKDSFSDTLNSVFQESTPRTSPKPR